jgi:hypothetical protein
MKNMTVVKNGPFISILSNPSFHFHFSVPVSSRKASKLFLVSGLIPYGTGTGYFTYTVTVYKWTVKPA